MEQASTISCNYRVTIFLDKMKVAITSVNGLGICIEWLTPSCICKSSQTVQSICLHVQVVRARQVAIYKRVSMYLTTEVETTKLDMADLMTLAARSESQRHYHWQVREGTDDVNGCSVEWKVYLYLVTHTIIQSHTSNCCFTICTCKWTESLQWNTNEPYLNEQ
jgi:hypothetical protein